MAAITVYAKNATMNWDDASAWNDASNGSGTNYTNPQDGVNAFTCQLNGKTVTLNVDVTVTAIQASGATGVLAVSGTRIINAAVSYSGTATTGMITVGTGAAVTINGECTNSSSGYLLVKSGTGTFTVSNVGGTALNQSAGGGRVISTSGTGICSVTGGITAAATGYGLYNGGADVTVTGDVSETSNGYAIYNNTGTVNVIGNMSNSAGAFGYPLYVAGGTATWVGSRSLASGVDCFIGVAGGTLNLATASDALSLACSGNFVIRKTSGTLTTVNGSHTAAVSLQLGTASAAVLGNGTVSLITYLNYPYGDNSAAKVLTTAAGAGTYVQPVVGQVLAPAQGGTAYGASSGTSGTLTLANSQYVLTTCPDYGIAGTGGAKTATIPSASNVLTGTGTYGVNGTGSTPSYSPDFPDVANVLTTDTTNGSTGTYAVIAVNDALHKGSGYFGVGAASDGNYYGPSSQSGVTTATTYGVGNATSGSLDMSLYELVTTGDTRVAAQLSSDQAAVLASAAFILTGHSILSQAGTLNPVFPAQGNVLDTAPSYGLTGTEYTGTFSAGGDYAAGYSDGEAAQLVTDTAAVTAAKAGMTTTTTILGVTGTLNMSLYCLVSGLVFPVTDEVDGGVHYGPTGTEYEGTGVNATSIRSALGMASANLDAQLAGLAGDTGSGANAVTITVDDGTDPLEGAKVRLTKGALSYLGTTDASGHVNAGAGFSLDDGTWTVTITLGGYTFTPTTLVIAGDVDHTYSMTAETIPASAPSWVTGYLYCYDEAGSPKSGVSFTLAAAGPPDASGIALDTDARTASSIGSGLVSFVNLLPGAQYRIKRGTGSWLDFTVPTGATSPFAIPDLLGP